MRIIRVRAPGHDVFKLDRETRVEQSCAKTTRVPRGLVTRRRRRPDIQMNGRMCCRVHVLRRKRTVYFCGET